MLRNRNHLFFVFLLMTVVMLFDAASKYLIQHYYRDFVSNGLHGVLVFSNFLGIDFWITYATNRGAAWGTLSNYSGFLLTFRISLIVGLILYLIYFNQRPAVLMPFVLIIAGALGNVVDFFLYGHVIDMFDFVLWGYNYPVFNVADSAIFIGVFWLLFVSWRDVPTEAC